MSRKIGDGRNVWRPGNEDLPMLVERLYAQREDRAWLSLPERAETIQTSFPPERDETSIALPRLTDTDYWSSTLFLPPDWLNPSSLPRASSLPLPT